MKIYILADMEGISGIRLMAQVQREQAEYAQGCALMMQEINVAVDAALAGGATEVVVADTHGGGGQVLLDRMDPRAVYELPQGGGRMMPALDETFAGMILLGHHARAGTLDGFLDHTMNSSGWFEYRINDVVVGEIGIEAAYAGHFGVPVIMVSGDETTAAEARATLGTVETAVVKWGLGRNRARCLALAQAHEVIRATVREAVRGAAAKRYQPYRPSLPGTIELTLYRSDMADEFAAKPGVERINARTVRRQIDSLVDVNRW